MIGTACALLVAAGVVFPQDEGKLVGRVKELVEQLRSDDLVVADDALAGLVKLGPDAVPFIKQSMESASMDTRLRLESAVKQIARNVRRERAIGKPIAVTLRVADKPVAEALAELTQKSDKAIEFADLPEGNVTVDVGNGSFWAALDGLCRSHGGIMWRIRGTKIAVEKRPYRDVPKVILGNLMMYLDELSTSNYAQQGHKWSHLRIAGRLAWVEGTRPQAATLAFDDLEDDKGVSLANQPNNYGWYDAGGPEGPALSMPLNYSHQTPIDDGATELTKCKGAVTVRYVLETKRIITIPNPAGARGQAFDSGGASMRVEDCTATPRTFSGRIAVTRSGEQRDNLQIKPSDIVIVDKKGSVYSGKSQNQGSSSMHNGTSWTITWYYQVSFSLPEDAEIASLDLQQPVDTEEIVLPFDFKGLKLK
jgi:hypothetical protein